jgi:hypothetical protein
VNSEKQLGGEMKMRRILLKLVLFVLIPASAALLLLSRAETQSNGAPEITNMVATSFVHQGDTFISFDIHTSGNSPATELEISAIGSSGAGEFANVDGIIVKAATEGQKVFSYIQKTRGTLLKK